MASELSKTPSPVGMDMRGMLLSLSLSYMEKALTSMDGWIVDGSIPISAAANTNEKSLKAGEDDDDVDRQQCLSYAPPHRAHSECSVRPSARPIIGCRVATAAE